MSDITAKRGTKIEPDEAKGLDRAKMGTGQAAPTQGDVEGQALGFQWVVCPWCGAMNWCLVDSNIYLWFNCWHCGGAFKA